MSTLPRDDTQVPTSAKLVDPSAYAPGATEWVHFAVTADGGDKTQGAKADTGNTATDTTALSIVAILKGLGIRLASLITNTSKAATGLMKAEDDPHASGDYGVMALGIRRDTAAVSSGASGDYEPLQLDALGRQRVVERRGEVDATNSTSAALEATRLVKATAGKLFGLQGYSAVAGFVIVGDKTSALNGTSDNFRIVIPVEAGKPFSLDLGWGRAFANGISIGLSTTGPTWTTGGSNMWVDAQYE